MSQQINLFNPIFREKGFSLSSATAMLYGVGLAVLVSAMGAAYAQYQLRAATAQAQGAEQALKETQARFDKLAADMAQQKPNATLEAEISRLDAQLKGRQEVVEVLKSGAVGNTGGFSDYMRAFSRQNVSGLWLTGFDIARGGNELAIQGRTLNADLVATFLKQLNQEKSLQGLQFATLRIGQPAVEPSAAGGEPRADSTGTSQKDARETASTPPRYLEFTLSTIALPDDVKQAASPAATPGPILGALDPGAAKGSRNIAITQGAPK